MHNLFLRNIIFFSAFRKYLRDSEREQLSRQALTLCQQSLRSRVQAMGSASTIDSVHLIRTDARTQVLLDVYETYQLVQKHFQGKDLTIQAFATLLTDTYKMYIGNKVSIVKYYYIFVNNHRLYQD